MILRQYQPIGVDDRKVCFSISKTRFYIFAILLIVTLAMLLFANVEVTFQHDIKFIWSKMDTYQYEDLSEKSYFIRTNGCTIPAFDPFDEAILKYVYKEKPIECYNSTSVPLVDSNLTSLWIIEKHLVNYGVNDSSLLSCCYRPFYRPSVDVSKSDDRYEYDNICVNFTEPVRIDKEFIRVECLYKNTPIYKDFHFFVQSNKKYEHNTKKVNVLILGIDAVSRLNFLRTMPKTVKFLKDIGASDFKGYNKVGDNTYPNLVPVLSGYNETELSQVCLAEKDPIYDECPFIWKEYQKQGFQTALAEDAANIAVFNYLKDGFAGKPTDYYWRTFDYRAEAEIGHEKHLNAKLCIGPRLTLDVLLKYTYKFVKTMNESANSYFGFFWETSLTHDYLNYPMLADESYFAFLKTLQEEGLLENTVLILLSDHGIRWGGIRSTHQGRMEERLPFLYIALPKSFKEKYPIAAATAQKNTKGLTTPFDLHETLQDLTDVDELRDERIKQRASNGSYANSRGISLFLPVHPDRTCQSAGIDPHWCTCHDTTKLDTNNDIIKLVSNVVVKHMNSMLEDYVQCAKLNLTEILDARIAKPFNSSQVQGVEHVVHDYTVVVHTEPGGGLFEATVRQTPKSLNVTGTISRINLYGKQGYCVDNFHLKLYCYCDSSISPFGIFR